jgi:hypothetical protein
MFIHNGVESSLAEDYLPKLGLDEHVSALYISFPPCIACSADLSIFSLHFLDLRTAAQERHFSPGPPELRDLFESHYNIKPHFRFKTHEKLRVCVRLGNRFSGALISAFA